MKIYLSLLLTTVAFAISAFGAEFTFDIPGHFLVSVRGTLYVTAPDGWSVATVYDEDDAAQNPPPRFPGPMIQAKNATGAEMLIHPMDIEEHSVIDFMNERLGKDNNGTPLPFAPMQGANIKGSVCFRNPAHPIHAHGSLEAGRLLLSFVVVLNDPKEWEEAQGILKSFRFEEHESIQQGVAPYVDKLRRLENAGDGTGAEI